MIDSLKLIIVLTVISCVAALLIAFTNSKTAGQIALQQAATQETALKNISPAGASFSELRVAIDSKDTITYWNVATGTDSLYCFKIGSGGYSSTINYLVCVDTQGIISGMAILDQNETPGLGTRIQEIISDKYIWNVFFVPEDTGTVRPWFTTQFEGISIVKSIGINKTVGEWHKLADGVKATLQKENSITAITGSTISTRAVTNGLNIKAKSYLKAVRG